MSATRDQIITFLLQNDDNKEMIIAELQRNITQLKKELQEKINSTPSVQEVNGKDKSSHIL